jgi:hypothetical protein
VLASGGKVIILGKKSSNLLSRATELRDVVQSGVDVVVLHIHPYDVIPSIGLTDINAKVLFLNHADHVFWVGAGIANVVADIRPAGQQLSLAKRCLGESGSEILPIPLSVAPATEKFQARTQLGISNEAIVIISIASGYKYGASPSNHFIDVHLKFVLARSDVILIVIGPEPKGRWLDASELTDGRFRAIGIINNINAYYDAADLYLDSLPFASLTSLLDAAIKGLPVLSLNETVPDSVLTSNDLSLQNKNVYFTNREGYVKALETLASSPDDRLLTGERVRAAVIKDHLSPGWNRQLSRVFESLKTESTTNARIHSPAKSESPRYDELEYALIKLQEASGLSGPLWACQLHDAPFMPAPERLNLLMLVPVERRFESLKYMISAVMRAKLKVKYSLINHYMKRSTK